MLFKFALAAAASACWPDASRAETWSDVATDIAVRLISRTFIFCSARGRSAFLFVNHALSYQRMGFSSETSQRVSIHRVRWNCCHAAAGGAARDCWRRGLTPARCCPISPENGNFRLLVSPERPTFYAPEVDHCISTFKNRHAFFKAS